ncbi:hypothetical protein ABVK25_010743 [Lepraria finkii]|uniref:Uncharacterized protein n=1 Tax=Lepraria finkii TaxID=1340010 RepID=A0ABR4AW87_9LECA
MVLKGDGQDVGSLMTLLPMTAQIASTANPDSMSRQSVNPAAPVPLPQGDLPLQNQTNFEPQPSRPNLPPYSLPFLWVLLCTLLEKVQGGSGNPKILHSYTCNDGITPSPRTGGNIITCPAQNTDIIANKR